MSSKFLLLPYSSKVSVNSKNFLSSYVLCFVNFSTSLLSSSLFGYTGKVGNKTQETNNAVIKENVTRIFASWKENHNIVISFKAANLKVATKRRRKGNHGRRVRSVEGGDSDGRISFIVPVLPV